MTQVFGETRTAADRIVDRAGLHERATPLLDADEAERGEAEHRAAHRVTVDVEALRQLTLARQPPFFAEPACRDLCGENLFDLSPDGHARAAFERRGRRRAVVRCHGAVIPFGSNDRHDVHCSARAVMKI
ncbi:hypothetical protein OKW41_001763 [Paraburkholderia sp. UCT70]